MSRYVVYESHAINDDKCEMPDMDDFLALGKRIENINQICISLVSKEAFDTKIRNLTEEIQKLANIFNAHKEELISTLENGQWKKSLLMDIDVALAQLEERYMAINNELNIQIAKLGHVDNIEQRMDEKICSFQQEIQKGIIEEKNFIKKEQNKLAVLEARFVEIRDECENIVKPLMNGMMLSLLLEPLCKEVSKIHW